MALTEGTAFAQIVFLCLMGAAAVHDAADRTLPNWLHALLGLSFFALFAPFHQQALLVSHLMTATTVLAVAYVLYSLHALGGGDAKLLALAALWIGPAALPVFISATAISGGVLSVGYSAYRAIAPVPSAEPAPKGLPFGIAIAIGALFASVTSPSL